MTEKSIVLLNENEAVFNRFQKTFGNEYKVHWGKDLNTTIDILLQLPVGVVVCDARFHNQEIYPVVLSLKMMHPELVIIVVSQGDDKQAIAELEQKQEIFAALHRPVTKKRVQEILEDAFVHYERNIAN
ncbi:MAG: hypothetical protein J6M05_06725 [Cardiobacteriaceae bacterium]|nr:hypothetical protein [Cardiobacteriaceae bacterium]